MLRLFPLYSRVLSTGEPQPYAEISVFDAGTANLTPLFELDGVTGKANPFDADEDGLIAFVCDGRLVDIDVEAPTNPLHPTVDGFEPYSYPIVPVGLAQYAVEVDEAQYAIQSGTTKGLIAATFATLPPVLEGRIRLLTDTIRGIWYSTSARWLSANGGVCNVQDFGAIGDGVTNDLAAFQAASTAAGVGGTVYIPPLTNGKFYNLSTGWVVEGYRGIRILGGGVSAVIASTTASSDALTMLSCHYFTISGLTVQGVAGGRHGIVVGNVGLTKPCHYGLIENVVVPPSVDGNGIQWYHGILGRIHTPTMGTDATRPCTDAALNGGDWGPNVATITSIGIDVPYAGGQNNGLTILSPIVDGWRGIGIRMNGVDGFRIFGNTVEGNAQNFALITKPAQIQLEECARGTIQSYLETTGALNTSDNLRLINCSEVTFDNSTYGAAFATSGGVYLENCRLCRLVNIFGEFVTIDEDCLDCVCDGVATGGNSGLFTDYGTRTFKTRMLQINKASIMAAGSVLGPQSNIITNPGLESWTGPTVPVGCTIVNATATQCGSGRPDTTVFRGDYCARYDTRVDPTNGLVWQVSEYAVATTRAAMVGQKVTFSAWVYITAGQAVGLSAYYNNGAYSDDLVPAYTVGVDGWRKLAITFVVKAGYVGLDCRIILRSDATVVYVDEVAIVYGEAASFLW